MLLFEIFGRNLRWNMISLLDLQYFLPFGCTIIDCHSDDISIVIGIAMVCIVFDVLNQLSLSLWMLSQFQIDWKLWIIVLNELS